MAALNNATTADAYSATATLECQPTESLTVTVSNKAVFYQLRLAFAQTMPSNADWQEERQLVPGLWNFSRADFRQAACTGIRFRSALAGAPAQVSASD